MRDERRRLYEGHCTRSQDGVRLSDGWSLCVLCESPVSICKTEPDNIFGSKLLLGGDHRQRKFPSNTFSSFQNYYEITP